MELDLAAAHAGISLNQTVEVATLDVAKRLVMAGVGYTVHFAAPVQPDLDEGHLVAVPIRGLYLRRFLARAAERPLSRATEEVITTIGHVVQDLVNSGGWLHARLEIS
jgi:LysR family nitrogen assimilation transcriptional regulator